ncbi:hypothetical protein MAE02_53830 [Microvirga aerophila]|uniref:Uncharacterized protein n=1 Tax=Microvirga aerophila TaxID=670291 RepID=A0A512C0W0_9HYPH|nr:hypothetical protein MAE02_53830 [Microvirga aerophila]
MRGGRGIGGKSVSGVPAKAEEANNTKAHATKVLDRLGLRKVCPSVPFKFIELLMTSVAWEPLRWKGATWVATVHTLRRQSALLISESTSLGECH